MPYSDPDLPILREAAVHLAGYLSAQVGSGHWHADGLDAGSDGYTYPPSVRGPGGAQLLLSDPDHYTTMQRVHIAGAYPGRGREWVRRDSAVVDSINVRLSRGHDVIGREVVRRLLPGYLPQLEQAQRVVAEHEAKAENRWQLHDDLVATVPGGYTLSSGRDRDREKDSRLVLPLHGKGHGTARITLYGPDSATVEMHSVPAEFLYELAELLARRAERASLAAAA